MVPPLDNKYYILSEQGVTNLVYHYTFRYLLPDKDFRLFKKRLAKSIDDVSEKLIHIEHTDLLEKMGFPENWKNITRYRLTKSWGCREIDSSKQI